MTNTPDTPDQVDALDAAFDTIRKDGKPLIREAHIADAKAKLSALLVEAREQGALAHAESLTASGKQADNPHLGPIKFTVEWGGLWNSVAIAELEDGPALQVQEAAKKAHGAMLELGMKLGLSQRLKSAVGQDKSSKNAPSKELEKQREAL